MKHSVRAIGWTATIGTIIIFLFIGVAGYSIFRTFLMEDGLQIGEMRISLIDSEIVLSIPITLNNKGYFSIDEFEFGTSFRDINGSIIVQNSTIVREIRSGSNRTIQHILALDLLDMVSNRPDILFNDTDFTLNFLTRFRYAYAFNIEVSIAGMPIHWGAPLYGLRLEQAGPPTFNGTHLRLPIFVEVENHSFLDIRGNLTVLVYNREGQKVGSAVQPVELMQGSGIRGSFEMIVGIYDLYRFTGSGFIEYSLSIAGFEQTLTIWRQEYGI
ncbi:MAG: hypothetical protein RMJ07_02590 [Nitrososphaerota archaeon]|nr:hypothetical protein [Nitrososphaerota archaeon]